MEPPPASRDDSSECLFQAVLRVEDHANQKALEVEQQYPNYQQGQDDLSEKSYLLEEYAAFQEAENAVRSFSVELSSRRTASRAASRAENAKLHDLCVERSERLQTAYSAGERQLEHISPLLGLLDRDPVPAAVENAQKVSATFK